MRVRTWEKSTARVTKQMTLHRQQWARGEKTLLGYYEEILGLKSDL